jgi:hypothetical protein
VIAFLAPLVAILILLAFGIAGGMSCPAWEYP